MESLGRFIIVRIEVVDGPDGSRTALHVELHNDAESSSLPWSLSNRLGSLLERLLPAAGAGEDVESAKLGKDKAAAAAAVLDLSRVARTD